MCVSVFVPFLPKWFCLVMIWNTEIWLYQMCWIFYGLKGIGFNFLVIVSFFSDICVIRYHNHDHHRRYSTHAVGPSVNNTRINIQHPNVGNWNCDEEMQLYNFLKCRHSGWFIIPQSCWKLSTNWSILNIRRTMYDAQHNYRVNA